MVTYTKDALKDSIEKFGWSVGDHTYGTPHVQRWGVDGKLHIGRYCSMAGNVRILLGGNHRDDFITTYPFNVIRPGAKHITGHPTTKGSVVIGNDVWLAQACVITSGVTIGDGAIVGTEAVVSKSVPPYAIVVGNPAKIVRYRFPEAHIAELLKCKWWDWADEEINSCYDLLMSTNVSEFLHYARTKAR